MKESISEMVRVTLRRVKFVCGGRSKLILWGEQTDQSDEPQEKRVLPNIHPHSKKKKKKKKNMFHVTISK